MNTNENLKTSPLYPVYLVKLFNPSCFSIIHARRIIRRNWNSNAQSFYFFTDRDRNYSLSNVSTLFNPEITSVYNIFKLYTLSKLKQITRFFSPFDVHRRELKIETGRNNTSSRIPAVTYSSEYSEDFVPSWRSTRDRGGRARTRDEKSEGKV